MSTETTAVIGREYENVAMRSLRVVVRDVRTAPHRPGVPSTIVDYEFVSAPDFLDYQVGKRETRTLPEFLDCYDDDLDVRPPLVEIRTAPDSLDAAPERPATAAVQTVDDPRLDVAAKAIFTGILYGGTEAEWEHDADRRDWCRNIAHDVLAALGLRMIASVDGLHSLPLGTILRDERQRAARLGIKRPGRQDQIINSWIVGVNYVDDAEIALPATVIFNPEASS